MDSVSNRMTTPTLTVAAIKMFVRNRQALFFTLFMPLIIMTIFGLIGFDKLPVIKIGVVTNAPTAGTTAFVGQLKEIPNVELTVGTEEAERQALKKNDRAAVFMFPGDLIADVPPIGSRPQQFSPKTVTVLENVAQQQYAKTAETILNQALDKTALAMVGAPKFFELKTEDVSVKKTRYIDFLLPGIVGLALMQMAVFSVAFIFTDYKEKGILKRLVATPMKPSQFLTANVITRLIVAMAQTAVLITVGILLYKTHVYGAWWLIALIATLGAIMFLGLGFTISGLAKTVDAVPAIANLIVFPMLFLGGTFFPIDTMPVWLQHVVKFLPLQYLTHSLREVMANGAGLSAVATDLYWMLGWSAALIMLANLTFGFEEKRV